MQFGSDHLNLIADLYDTSIDYSLWPSLLDRTAHLVGSKMSSLYAVESLDASRFEVHGTSSLFTRTFLDDYANHLSQYDAEGMEIIARSTPGTIIRDQDVWLDRQAFTVRPDVIRMREDFGILHRAGMRLNDQRAWMDVVVFQFDQSRGNITPQESDVVRLFWPHIAKSIAMNRAFSALQSRFNAVLGALDRFHIGLFLVTRSGSVIHHNASASNLLARKDGVSLTKARTLSIADSDRTAELAGAIDQISRTVQAEGIDASRTFRVSKPSGGDPYLIEVSPLKDVHGEIDPRFKGAIVSVIDPDDRIEISTRGLLELYDLTPAEIAVAELLVVGRTAHEIADIRSVSFNTARSQIRSLMTKTGTSNRTDFIRLALTVNLPIA